ncbi:hypothetical protein BGZ98_007602 [Dissophora globulifera]|nr:hypothetical protein BGZ98_007602 [Dissophora globulifera]
MHAADFVWGETYMDPTMSSSESEPASCKNTSDVQLRQLEENFMRQSFLEAFEAATMSRHRNVSKPPPSVTMTDESIRNATTDDAPKEFDRCIYGPDGDRISTPFMSVAQGSQYRPFQLMTTTQAMAQESECAQVNTCILPLCTSDERERGWMRQLDFSLDDLLVQVVSGQEFSENSVSTSSRPRIVGVSRWKKFAPVMAAPESSATYVPRSCNTFQVAARASPYPLIHLFSFPDISIPPKLGDEEISTEGQASKTCGLANSLAQLLALKSPRVAEFLTCTLAEKEIILYHRWMAAWHERSPFAPEATRRRLDILVAARRYKSQEAARRLARFHERAGRRILNPSESDALRQSSLDLQTVQCPRCMEDIAGNEMVAADVAYFEESIRLLDEALCASPHEEQAQGGGDEGGHDGSLGMSTRDPQMARTLPLARTTELQAARGTVDEPWLRLTKEEQALIRRQLFQGN